MKNKQTEGESKVDSSTLFEKMCIERTARHLSMSPLLQAQSIAKHYCAYALLARQLLELLESSMRGSDKNVDDAVDYILKQIKDGHAHDLGIPLVWSNPTEQRTGHLVDGTLPPVVLPPDSENQSERK